MTSPNSIQSHSNGWTLPAPDVALLDRNACPMGIPIVQAAKDEAPAATEASGKHTQADSEIIDGAPRPSKGQDRHAEARRLLDVGMKLAKLRPLSKQPDGPEWNHERNYVTAIAGGEENYGALLAANKLCSLDIDNAPLAREGLRRAGFDLDELRQAGVYTTSTRPGSGGRVTFRAVPGMKWLKFSSKTRGTILEFRADSPNLQDCLPGTVYTGKDGGGPYRQDYADPNGRKLDRVGVPPPKLLEWAMRCASDVDFYREQQRLICGDDAQLAISSSNGKSLAYPSHWRRSYNDQHNVEDILAQHGYDFDQDSGRWAPATATGAPCVRAISGKDGLWQSDHASDPLFGTFDAWTAHVVLDHDGDLAAAEDAQREAEHQCMAGDYTDVTQQNTDCAEINYDPVALDWSKSFENLPPIPYIVPGWIQAFTVTLFSANGGVGKSYVSLYVAICLCVGRHPFLDGASIPRVKVTLYSSEDDDLVLSHRAKRYARMMGIELSELNGWLLILDATGCDNTLFIGDDRDGGRTTGRFKWLQKRVKDFGADLLIFDNSSDAMGANENSRPLVRKFITSLKHLAPTVLLLAHVDAATVMAEPGKGKGFSGSTAWNNSVRSRLFMFRDDKDSNMIILRQAKANNTRDGSEAVIRWDDAAMVFKVVEVRQGNVRAADNRQVLLRLLMDATERMEINVSPKRNSTTSPFNSLKNMPGFPSGLETGNVGAEVCAWLAEGLARVEDYRQKNRTTAQRLVLTDLGRSVAMGSGAGDVL